MSKNNMVPSIRFKEFTNAWEQERLGEIVDYFNGSSNEKEQTNEGKFEIVNLNSISISGELKPSGKFLHNAFETLKKGDIVMILSDIALGNLLGKSAVIPVDNRYVLNQRVALLRKNNSKFNSKFISLFLNKNQSLLFRKGAGSSQLNLSKKEVINFLIFSTSRNEQDKVSLIFNNINSLITLHQRKLNALENLKKTLLEKMFPNENSVFPSVRFKEFTNAWEQEKIENICDRFDNYRIPISEKNRIKGNTPYYGANGIQDYVKGYTHSGENILIAEDGVNDVNNYSILYVNEKIWVNNHAHVIKASNKLNNNFFISLSLKRVDWSSLLVGGERFKLNASTLMNIFIKICNTNEQNKISIIFNNINSLITLHQRKLNALENLKKTLLEKMFV
ncbi:restriction endonuclease subunit S [Mycoplasmopsis cynos]|uniref:restriction endonuclease subunit S n=1 Tax=Mycoplasmopsis cynos TaxID=171284 RepID=UPI002AFEBB8F|nr:restriction endonuclease subunit S [Mycoplasmopsis cynos]WQQ16020.1 restriction endonuclease subunit S [Mycoplasmopsis cynos]